MPLPPGNEGWPIVGETLEFLRSPSRFVASRRARYGAVFRSRVLGANTVFLVGPEANRFIFTNEERLLRNRWSSNIRRLLGAESLAMLEGDAHRRRRQLLAPLFTRARMARLSPLIARLVAKHLERWAARGRINVFASMRALLFEVIAVVLLGEDAVELGRLSALFETWTAGMFTLVPLALPFSTFRRALLAKRQLMVEIERAVRAREQLAVQPDDLLGAVLQERRDAGGATLSTKAIVHELQLQLFAGHDTSVSVLSNLMLTLARHPEIAARARAEQRALSGKPTAETAEQPYLDAVLFEALRYLPPVAGAFRTALQDIAYAGHRIPKGWTIAFSIVGTHQVAWSAPEKFDPDRFLGRRPDPFAWVPFGGGPRVCLGQQLALTEIRIILTQLLQRYHWELIPGQDLTMRSLPFPRPKSGIEVRFCRSDAPEATGSPCR